MSAEVALAAAGTGMGDGATVSVTVKATRRVAWAAVSAAGSLLPLAPGSAALLAAAWQRVFA